MVPILNQWLRFYPTESMTEFFSQYRQDCPFPLSINRGWIPWPEYDENRVQKLKKNQLPLVLLLQRVLSPLSLSIMAFGHHHSDHWLDHHHLHQPSSSPAVEQPLPVPLSLSYTFSSSSFTLYNRPPTHPSPPPPTSRHPPTPTLFWAELVLA